MASSIIKNLLNSLQLTDEPDFDGEYDEYVNEMEEKERKREERLKQKQQMINKESRSQTRTPSNIKNSSSSQRSAYNDDDEYESSISSSTAQTNYRERSQRTERPSSTGRKVVPIGTTAKGLEVCIMKPTSFEDSQDICDILLSGRAAVINLEGFDVELAQRVMDFVSGSVYALNGRLHQISSYIFIISPDTVDISGDYLDIIRQDGFGFGAPTLSRVF